MIITSVEPTVLHVDTELTKGGTTKKYTEVLL